MESKEELAWLQELLLASGHSTEATHAALNAAIGGEETIAIAKAHAQEATVCGKLFTRTEPAYSCYTCGVDPTCIQCLDCFKDSDHTGHDIRMTRASGGGCCDCGDTTSWDSKGACSKHKPKADDTKEKSLQDCKDILGTERFDLVYNVFQGLIRTLAFSFIGVKGFNIVMGDTKKHVKECRSALLQGLPLTSLHVLNDDSVSFDRAIDCIRNALRSRSMAAEVCAVRVDLLSTTALRFFPPEQISELDDMERRLRSLESEIRTRVESGLLTNSEATDIFIWLSEVCKISDIFRVICQNCIAENLPLEAQELPSRLSGKEFVLNALDVFAVVAPSFTSKMWRSFEEFTFQMMLSFSFKRSLAQVLLRWFLELWQYMDHVGSMSKNSFLGFSVQLFTVSTLVHEMLLWPKNVLRVQLDAFSLIAKAILKPDKTVVGRIGQSLFGIQHEIGYIFATPGVADVFVNNSHLISILENYVTLLVVFEGMDPQKRIVSGSHIEHESESWQTAFLLSMEMHSLSTKFLRLIEQILDRSIQKGNAKIIQNKLGTCLQNLYLIAKPFCEEACMETDFSFHWNMRRFLGQLVQTFHLKAPEALNELNAEKSFWVGLAEPLINVRIFSSQVANGLWVRNGFSMVYQLAMFRNSRVSNGVVELDIGSLQVFASYIGIETFFDNVWRKFESQFEDEILRKISFLELLIQMSSERQLVAMDHQVNVVVRKKLIHSLISGGMTFSQILESLNESESDVEHKNEIREALDELCRFIPPTGLSEGKFELKASRYLEFDPFYVGFDERERNHAEQHYMQKLGFFTKNFMKISHELAIVDPSTLSIYPPIQSIQTMGTIHPSFQAILDVFHLSEATRIIAEVLNGDLTNSHELQAVLRFVSIGVYEAFIRKSLSQRQEMSYISSISYLVPSLLKSSHYLSLSFSAPDINTPFSLLTRLNHWILSVLRENLEDPSSKLIGQQLDSEEKDQVEIESKKRKKEKMKRAREKALREIQMKQTAFMKKNLEVVGKNSKMKDEKAIQMHECILCRSSNENGPLGILAWISKSSVLREKLVPSMRCKSSISEFVEESFDGILIQSCGHTMHYSCKNNYVARLNQRLNSFRVFEGYRIVSVEDGEFLCPFCKGMANSLIPIPTSPMKNESESKNSEEEAFKRDMAFELFCRVTETRKKIAEDENSPMLSYFLDCVDYGCRIVEVSASINTVDFVRSLKEQSKGMRSQILGMLYSLVQMDAECSLIEILDFNFKSSEVCWSRSFSKCWLPLAFSWLLAHERELFDADISDALQDSIRSFLDDRKKALLEIRNILADQLLSVAVQQLCVMTLQNFLKDSETICTAMIGLNLSLLPPSAKLSDSVEEVISNQGTFNRLLNFLESSSVRYLLILLACGVVDIETFNEKKISTLLEDFLGTCLADICKNALQTNLILRTWEDLLNSLKDSRSTVNLQNVFLTSSMLNPISLPAAYDDLFQTYSGGICAECSSKSRYSHIHICLLCGITVCKCKNVHLSSKGPLSQHCIEAHSSNGMFLDIRNSTTILLRDGYSAEYYSPYLDQFGEEDRGLKRGRPLLLNEPRWKKLQELWLTSTIDLEVSRRRFYLETPSARFSL